MEAAFRKVKEGLSQRPARLLASAMSHLSVDRARAHSQTGSQSAITPEPYRSNDLGHIGMMEDDHASNSLDDSHNPHFSSRGHVDQELEQAGQYLAEGSGRTPGNTPINPGRDVFTPLFGRQVDRLNDQVDFWSQECLQYLREGDLSLAILESYQSEIKNLTRQLEQLNPDKVPIDEKAPLEEKYQAIRRLHLRLISVIGGLKDKAHARQSIKVCMPQFSDKPVEYLLFKAEFSSWAKHLTESEKRVSFLKALEGTEAKQKVQGASTYQEMLRALDSHYGNNQVIVSRLFSELQTFSKPGFNDFHQENSNTLKILGYLSFLDSIHRSEVSVFESQLFCSLLRQSNLERYVEEVGQVGNTESTQISKVRKFMDKLIQKNDAILNTKASITNMKSKNNEEKKKHRSHKDLTAKKANIKEQVKVKNKDDSKPTRPPPRCRICQEEHFAVHCSQVPTEISEATALFKILNLCIKCSFPIKPGDRHDNCMMSESRKKYLCPTHAMNKAFCCSNKALETIKSNVCKINRRINNDDDIVGGDSLLGLEEVKAEGTTLLCLYDGGSSHNLMDSSLKHLCRGISKTKVVMSAVDASKIKWMEIGILYITATNPDGREGVLKVQVYLTDLNSDRYSEVSLRTPATWTRIYQLPGNYVSSSGTPQLILGNAFLHQHPHTIITNYEGLSLTRSSITNNYFIQGAIRGHVMDKHTESIKSNRVTLAPADRDFLSYNFMEELPLSKKCMRCNVLQCSDCEQNPFNVNEIQQEQDQEMLKLLKYDQEGRRITTDLPFNNLLCHLPSHFRSNLKMFETFERKVLKKEDHRISVNEQILEMMKREFFVKEGSISEVNTEEGTFLPLTMALKEGSTSTPIRLCYNASYRGRCGTSLNDTMLTGSSHNVSIQQLMFHLRLAPVLHVADVSKAYQAVHVSTQHQKYLRILWREGGLGGGGPLVVLRSTRLLFGLKPAQTLFSLARNIAFKSTLNQSLFQEVSQASYTDNIHLVSKTRPEGDAKAEQVSMALERMGFHLKTGWNISGQSSDSPETSLLGLQYLQSSDQLKVMSNFNLLKRVRGEKPKDGQMTKPEDVDEKITEDLTKRDLIIISHAVFDPIGLFIPITSALKIIYRNTLLMQPDMDWTDKIPKAMIPEIRKVIKTALKIKDCPVSRYALEGWTSQRLRLIAFTDAGQQGQVARVFAHSINSDKSKPADSAYLLGRHKLNQEEVSGSVPRAELSALLLGARTLDAILRMKDPRVEEVLLCSDSEVALTLCLSSPSTLNSWTAVRVTEAQYLIKKNQIKLHFISGVKNPADHSTKKMDLNKVFQLDYWQPSVLRDPDIKELKPVEEVLMKTPPDFIRRELRLCVNLALVKTNDFVQNILGLRNSFKKLARIVTIMYQWKHPRAEAQEMARNYLLDLGAPESGSAEIKALSKTYEIQMNGDKAFAKTRDFVTEEGNVISSKYRIVSKDSKIMEMIVEDAHLHGIGFLSHLQSILRSGVVSLNIKKLVKKHQARCARCRRIRMLPSHNTETPDNTMVFSNLPPFACIQMDIAGYFELKDQVKAYCLISCCSWSSAVLFSPLRSLSATEVLQGLETAMTSVGRGMPHQIYSDSAPSFISLKEIQQGRETGEMEDEEYRELEREVTERGVRLINHAPYSPHKTGRVERKVSNLKAMLRAHTGDLRNIDYFEFFHLLKKCQYLVNCRPVSCYTNAMSTLVISPNDIVFPSQSSMHCGDLEDFPEERSIWKDYNKVNKLYKNFKEIFLSLYLETARRRNRETSKRKLAVDDVVVILDRLTRGTDLALAQVVDVDSDQKNVLLRTLQKRARVNNIFKILEPAKMTRLVRSPNSLVFILRPDSQSDLIEYYRSQRVNSSDPELWSELEEEPVGDQGE